MGVLLSFGRRKAKGGLRRALVALENVKFWGGVPRQTDGFLLTVLRKKKNAKNKRIANNVIHERERLRSQVTRPFIGGKQSKLALNVRLPAPGGVLEKMNKQCRKRKEDEKYRVDSDWEVCWYSTSLVSEGRSRAGVYLMMTGDRNRLQSGKSGESS